MNVEEIPFRVFMRWVLFGVACCAAAIIFGLDNPGLIPAVFLFAFLVVCRPEREKFTDAELEAWLARG